MFVCLLFAGIALTDDGSSPGVSPHKPLEAGSVLSAQAAAWHSRAAVVKCYTSSRHLSVLLHTHYDFAALQAKPMQHSQKQLQDSGGGGASSSSGQWHPPARSANKRKKSKKKKAGAAAGAVAGGSVGGTQAAATGGSGSTPQWDQAYDASSGHYYYYNSTLQVRPHAHTVVAGALTDTHAPCVLCSVLRHLL